MGGCFKIGEQMLHCDIIKLNAKTQIKCLTQNSWKEQDRNMCLETVENPQLLANDTRSELNL